MASLTRGRCLLGPLLKSRNLSQSELARRTGINKRMISFYVKNERLMSVDAMYNISRVLGCNMEELYEWIPK